MDRISRRSVVGGALLVPVALLGMRGVTASHQPGTPAASPQASPMASPAASPAADGQGITVVAVDTLYDMSEIRIPADTDFTVTLQNDGFLQHDFVITDLGVATQLVDPGKSESVVINAPAGEYEYYCTVAGHKESGMVGTLIVQ